MADVGGSTKTPSDFLKSIRGKPVVVKLNSGVDYRGEDLHGMGEQCVSCCLTQFLRKAAQDCLAEHFASTCLQEYVQGQLKKSFGDVFIRGNNAPTHLSLQFSISALPDKQSNSGRQLSNWHCHSSLITASICSWQAMPF
eukprot:jgi/Astpho2/8230/Aster-01319